MIPVIPYPDIDAVAVQLGPLVIRWYSLAYIAGLLLGWRYCLWLARRPPRLFEPRVMDDFLVWAVLAVILGGRLGYVLFYKPAYYSSHPQDIFFLWQGGMSFHGGFLGVILAVLLFARHHRIQTLAFGDFMAAAAPIGLFLGRLANFVNGELYGRVSDLPWAMVFPHGGLSARHPSQLYEAVLEGPVLFFVFLALIRSARALERPGLLTGAFFVGYGLVRIFAEIFRQPDAHIGFLVTGTTMGQWLSLPMIAVGVWLIARTKKTS